MRHRLAAAALLLAAVPVRAQPPEPAAAAEAARLAIVPAFLARLTGAWRGTLEYRDYRGGARVRLPTDLRVGPSPQNRSWTLGVTYDDGPGRLYENASLASVDRERRRFVVASASAGEAPEVWHVVRADTASRAAWTLVMERAGEDDDRPALLRETWTLGTDGVGLRLGIAKDVQFADSAFAFRNRLDLRPLR